MILLKTIFLMGGKIKNVSDYLKLVCFNEEVQAMPDKENTMVGKRRRAALRRSGTAPCAGKNALS